MAKMKGMLTDDALDFVTGGTRDVDMSNRTVEGDVTLVDQTNTQVDQSEGKLEIAGDYTGGNQT